MALRIGQIDYANCTPIFTALKANCDCSTYRFVPGVPAQLNGMLNRGEIDICPSSSIEYARNPGKYFILPDISISSIGPVKSVLLFSRFPLEDLDQKQIGLTRESETSVNLLRILLTRDFRFENRFEITTLKLDAALESFAALLLIGDAALTSGMTRRDLYIYDLGELWYRFTGLPFVFALWMVTREAVKSKPDEVRILHKELIAAKGFAYDSYEAIADDSRERSWIGREELVEYWRTISYDLTDRHVKGARTFFRLAREMQLLSVAPRMRMFPLPGV